MAVLINIQFSLSTVVFYAVAIYLASKIVTAVQRIFFHPLSQVPGPTICATSRLYEFWWDSIYQHGRLWTRMPTLHEKYGNFVKSLCQILIKIRSIGPIVRIGPNEVHIHDLEYFNQLMAFRPLNKWAMTAHQFGISEAIFGTEDYKHYTKKRAAFGDSFSRSSALRLQGLFNEHLDKACDIIKQRNIEGKTMDLA